MIEPAAPRPGNQPTVDGALSPAADGSLYATAGSRYTVDFDEDFSAEELDPARWFPYYLPHWAGRERAAARYDLRGGTLRLRIDADSPVWHPASSPGMRVSNLQTGHLSGPAGSTRGQHRTNDALVVVDELAETRLYTPHRGLIEARVRAEADPRCMVALWLIGVEDEPHRSAEICVFEIFGSDIRPDSADVGVGVKPHRDPGVMLDFERIPFAADVTAWHTYAAAWTEDAVLFFFDGRLVKTVRQRIDYPMQLMLDIFEFDAPERADPRLYPKVLAVDFVRGHRPRD